MPGDRDGPRRRGGWDALAVCAVLAAAAAIVAGLAWTRPTATSTSLGYRQVGRLSYQATVRPTSIYGSTRVTTGQPVYADVVTTVTMRYAYRFESSAPATMRGTEQMVATIDNGQGLARTVPLEPPTTFAGTHFDATGRLDLPALEAIATQFAKTTQGFIGASYGVTVSPLVHVHGLLGQVPVRATFDPPVKFSLSASALAPAATPSHGGATGGPGGRFAASSAGSVPAPGGQPTNLILGLTVLNLRVVALVVLAVALAAGAFVGWPLVRDATSEDERRRIVARHGPSLVEVRALPAGSGVVAVDLVTFEGLLQVAERTECPLLHADLGEAGHAYGVVDNGTVYRYGPPPGSRPPTASWANGSSAPTHLTTWWTSRTATASEAAPPRPSAQET
jgi:hypothetical protein